MEIEVKKITGYVFNVGKHIIQFKENKERIIIQENGYMTRHLEIPIKELEAILNKSQSTISHHLRKLERAELIHSFKKGNYTYYGRIKEKLKDYIEKFNNEIKKITSKLNIIS